MLMFLASATIDASYSTQTHTHFDCEKLPCLLCIILTDFNHSGY
ncbi:hypothetical protein LSH36_316g07037 [Paralvinella palmiformis]|uniref:Uncharacterized protein n=1 Tax=Paralvinella palmiformis TaxID=53620 RepID=A0AAD9N138_9ANNE|nr:hypothetical protein LSH36_316g07037 [Paralvinella palmiformis]